MEKGLQRCDTVSCQPCSFRTFSEIFQSCN